MKNIILNHLTNDFQIEFPNGDLTNIMYWNEFVEYCLNQFKISIPENSELEDVQSHLPVNYKVIVSERLFEKDMASFVDYFKERESYLKNIYNILKLDCITEGRIQEIYRFHESYIQIISEELYYNESLEYWQKQEISETIKELCLKELSDRLTNKTLENIIDLSEDRNQDAIQEFSKGAYNFYKKILDNKNSFE